VLAEHRQVGFRCAACALPPGGPAVLLTSTCTGRAATKASSLARKASASDTSAASQPCCWRAFGRGSASASSCSFTSRRASTVTLAPISASAIALARPMPSDAPHTSACLSASE
jgi:hypothetical protein